ncbi:MAG: ribbon-helix-helix protein, CopG family [Xenococcaceae cyanobacterium]
MAMPRKRRRDSTKGSASKSKVGISLTPTALDTLSQMAQKTGLSRSQLIERIAEGSIAIASHSANTTITLETKQLAADQPPAEKGEKFETKIDVVTGEQQTPAQLAAQISEAAVLETEESLKQQSEEQAKLISELENQLAEQASSYDSLQQQLSEKSHQISELENQLAEQASSYDSVQQQLSEKSHQISELENQLAEQASSYDSVQQQLSEKSHQISALQQQLTEQQNQTAEQTSRYESVQQQLSEKSHQISELENQLAEQASLYKSVQQELSEKSVQVSELQNQLAEQVERNKYWTWAKIVLLLLPISAALLIGYYYMQQF